MGLISLFASWSRCNNLSVQGKNLTLGTLFCSITQSYPILVCHMNCSTPEFPVLHNLLELSQAHVHWVSNAIQSSHPLSLLLLLPSIFPSLRVFSNESALHISGQSIRTSISVLPMNIQGWFPLGLSVLISMLSKGLSRVFSSTTVRKHQFFGPQPSL